MPYIDESERSKFDLDIDSAAPDTAGELNYCITRLVNNWVKKYGVSYVTLNAAIGVMESAKQEFYRRAVSPYEDKKIEENGDVYSTG